MTVKTAQPSTTPSKKAKPKSPPAPSYPLADCVSDTQKLYDAFSRGEFSRAELASTLKISASSGPTGAKIFTLKEFGLLIGNKDSFRVSESFITLKSASKDSVDFKRAAYATAMHPSLFSELIGSFSSKLPPKNVVVTRLEQQKKFNLQRAEEIAETLEEALRYAGVVDSSGNIVPPRDSSGIPADGDGTDREQAEQSDANERQQAPPSAVQLPGHLKTEVPLKETRKVIVSYPPDLTEEEARKVGAVLAALVG